jgi:hypothetical protein
VNCPNPTLHPATRSRRLYLRKAEVVDVPAPGRCSLLLPETGESVADVREVPRPRELACAALHAWHPVCVLAVS